MSDTTTGLQENVAGLLCYLGWWITGIIFLILEPKNKFVRFHAVQSIIVSILPTILYIVFFWVPFLWIIIGLLWVALWIILMVKAYQGQMFKLPVAGDLAEKWSKPTQS